MTNEVLEPGPIVLPLRDGRRRKFTIEDKRNILAKAGRPGASMAEVARRYGIALRVLFRWKQELTQPTGPMFVAVEITDANPPPARALSDEEHAP